MSTKRVKKQAEVRIVLYSFNFSSNWVFLQKLHSFTIFWSVNQFLYHRKSKRNQKILMIKAKVVKKYKKERKKE